MRRARVCQSIGWLTAPLRSLSPGAEFGLAIAFILFFASSALAQGSRIARAERLYVQRPDLARVRQAISLLAELVQEDPERYEALWRLAKYSYFLGKHEDDKKERQDAFGEGIEAARRAVTLRPNRPEGHFWLAAIYGEQIQRKSVFTRWMLVKPLRKELEATIRIDPHHENGSAYAALGKLYSDAPGLFGGDIERGIQYLEKAVEIGPDNSLAKLFLAESYLKARRKQDAKRWLESILSQAPDRGYEFEYTENRRRAERLLREMK